MSASRQLRFLKKFHKELQQSSKEYRNEIANKLSHEFEMSFNGLKRACKDSYKRVAKDMNNISVSEDEAETWVNTNLKTQINECISKTASNFYNKRIPKGVSQKIKQTPNLVVSLTVNESSGVDIFSLIQARYDEPLKTLYSEFEIKLKDELNTNSLKYKKAKTNESSDLTRGFVFQLEHSNKSAASSNIDLFIAQQFEKSRKRRFKSSDAEAFATFLGLRKVIDPKKPTVVEVFLGSGISNIQESASERKRKKQLLEKLENAIAKLSEKNAIKIASLPGSDSAVDVERKKAIKSLEQTFKNSLKSSKTSKVEFKEEKKLGKSQKKFTKIKNVPKIKEARGKYKAPKPRKIRSKPKRSDISMVHLIGALNQQLPQTVAKNMGSPRLNYQTGRFASSVRVADIATTAKGFPSIGYTYMKYPYQTFEPGYRQGDVDRDPRKLIDRSIRDIAADFAIGRFYTRRV